MNIADQIFYDMYTLLNGVFEVSFIQIVGRWRPAVYLIITIALVLVGYKAMYSTRPDLTEFIKSVAVIVIVFFFFQNSDEIYGALKFAFIDAPVDAGNMTIGAMSSAMNLGGEDMSFNPDGTKTAFGALWEFSTALADRILLEGGWRNWTPLLVGLFMYVIAAILLVLQIILMATGLILASACILSSPVFIWMILFKPLRPMFEKWASMGLTAGILLFFMVVIMGVIIAFLNKSMGAMFNVDVFNFTADVITDDDETFELKQMAATAIFLGVAIKLLPKAENWASSIGSFSAHGLGEGAVALGGATSQFIGDKAKQVKDAPVSLKKGLDEYNKTKQENSNHSPDVRDQMLSSRIGMGNDNDSEKSDSNFSNPSETIPDQSDTSRRIEQNQKNIESQSNSREPVHANINSDHAELNRTEVNQKVDNDVEVQNEDRSVENNQAEHVHIEKSDDVSKEKDDDHSTERKESFDQTNQSAKFEQARTEEERRDAEERADNRKQSSDIESIKSKTQKDNTSNQYSDKPQESSRAVDKVVQEKTVVKSEPTEKDGDLIRNKLSTSNKNGKRKESKEFDSDEK